MPNPRPKTDHLKKVRTSEEARALAAMGAGRPRLPRPTVKRALVLYADQIEELGRRGVNASALIRELLDTWIAEHPEK